MFVKKIFLFAVVGVSLFYARAVYSAPAEAPAPGISLEEDRKIAPLRSPSNSLNPFFGQDHAYSVTFRGNGQAVVFLRVAFSNNGDVPTKELELRFPKVEPEGVLAYQVLRDKTCLVYEYEKIPGTYVPSQPPPCLEYSEPDYSDHYYGVNTYKKAKTSLSTDTLTIELPDSITSQKSGSVLLYFRAFGFAKKNVFGAYDYNFETLKVDDTIRSLRVGISPDSDLYMKSATGSVNYFKDSAPIFESSKTMTVGTSFTNASVDNAINNIGHGDVNKNASNLMPLDSYKVKGSYADSRLKLYAGTIAVSTAVAVAILLIVGFGVWRLFRVLKSKKPVDLAISALVGFVSAFVITTLVFLAYFFVRTASSWSSYSGDAATILPVLAALLFVGLIGMFLIFPCILIGVKRGIWWGLITFIFTLFWLFVAFLILGLVFVGFKSTPLPLDYMR